MIDINDHNFNNSFKIDNATIGVIGHGYVGQAMEHFFKRSPCTIIVNDNAKPNSSLLVEVVDEAEVIFVCVPTPMRKDGSCHTAIVENVLKDICDEANELERSLEDFVVVVKSTVYPGFIDDMKVKFPGLRVVFSPEFLTEKNSFEDIVTQNRIIVGGDDDDAFVVLKYFQGADPDRVANGELNLISTTSTTAELVKLFANGILATKVLFCNEIYLMAEVLGVEYEEVRQLACLDKRIGEGHTKVPGHDGFKGVGGHCFIKDLHNLVFMSNKLGTQEKLFSCVLNRNLELRESEGYDWLQMKGRAVIDE